LARSGSSDGLVMCRSSVRVFNIREGVLTERNDSPFELNLWKARLHFLVNTMCRAVIKRENNEIAYLEVDTTQHQTERSR